MEAVILQDLIKLEQKYCALATASKDGQPQVAIMAFAVLDTGHLLMSTDIHSHKVRNINENHHVALTIGWTTKHPNYQIRGEGAVIIEDDVAHKPYKEVYYKQNPHLGMFKDIPNHVFIRIQPTWIRVNDFSLSPPLIREFDLLKA